jgi:hypothetical protein
VKLLFCSKCQDVFKLSTQEKRYCACRACWGVYVDDLYADYGGDTAIPLGFSNPSLARAIGRQPEKAALGENFEAFVISKRCPTFKKRP